MIYNLNNDKDRCDFQEYCDKLKNKRCIVELKEKKHQRSIPQNNYLHLILGYFASEFGLTLEEVKFDIFKKTVNKEIFSRERENKRGQKITYIRSTTELDTGEMSVAIERFRNYSMSVADFYIPAPYEEEALIEAQRQIAYYEKYL